MEFLDESGAWANPTQTWTTLSTAPVDPSGTRPQGRILEKKITATAEPASYGFPMSGYCVLNVMLVALTGVPTDAVVSVAWDLGDFGSVPFNMSAPDVDYIGSDPMVITGFAPITDGAATVITPPSGHTELGAEIAAPTYAWFISGYSYKVETGSPDVGARVGVTSVRAASYPHWRSVTIAVPGSTTAPPSNRRLFLPF
jgi:hypothetical protein